MGEILAFVLYFVVMLGIGIYFFVSEKNSGEKEYFLGGRTMGPWVTAMSAQASDMSAWLLMGLPGSIIAFGLGQVNGLVAVLVEVAVGGARRLGRRGRVGRLVQHAGADLVEHGQRVQ